MFRMDPITHTMVGAAMARAGLDRGGTLPLAATTLMLAANAPDIDIFVMYLGSYAGLAFRRGWTHGPIALVMLPLLLTALVLAWDRLVRRRGERGASRAPMAAGATLLIASIGVVSHPALDWLNTYGIRLLMPFSREWFYGDACSSSTRGSGCSSPPHSSAGAARAAVCRWSVPSPRRTCSR